MHKLILILSLLFGCQAVLLGQDSARQVLDSIQIYVVHDQELSSPFLLEREDSVLKGFHLYENPFRLELGPSGAPGYDLLWKFDRPIGFYAGAMPGVEAEHQPLSYHHTNIPYTLVSAFFGSQEEQQFSLLHTQNIDTNWNLGVELERLNAVGFYERQKVVHSRFKLNSHYHKGPYTVFADYMIGVYNNQENGGVTADSFFTDNLTPNRKVVPFALFESYSERKHTGLRARQYFNFGKYSSVSDSTRGPFVPSKIRLAMTNRMDNTRFRYVDDLSNPTYYDTTLIYIYGTDDRSQWYRIQNDLSLQFIGTEDASTPQFRGSAGARFAYHEYRQNGTRSFARHLMGIGNVAYEKAGAFRYALEGESIVLGNQIGDYLTTLTAGWSGFSFVDSIRVAATLQARAPDKLYGFYYGNHFQWEQPLFQMKSQTLQAAITLRGVELGFENTSLTGFTYFDSLAFPQQDGSKLSVMHLSATKDFEWRGKKGWKWLIHLEGHYQKIKGTDKLRLPELLTTNSIAAEFPMFKRKMMARMGVEATYYSGFKANAYMPANGVFYLQDSLSIGNYPFVDVFFSARIRTVRLFVKMTHVQSGAMGYEYWAAPHYALRDRAFRIGLDWKFYN